MNKMLLGVIFCSLLVSCNDNRTNTQNNHADNKSSRDNKKIAALAEKLHGEWISEDYLRNIEAKKSIYLGSKMARERDILAFHLDKENLLTDTAALEAFVEHEGIGSAPIRYDEQNNRFIHDTKGVSRSDSEIGIPAAFELNYDGDKTIAMYFPKSKSTDQYRKMDIDLQTELRKILIAGNYKDISKNSIIKFDGYGKVDGFQEFKYYSLVDDYASPEGIEYDAILFFKSAEGGNMTDATIYKYEILPNALHLQLVNTDWDTYEHELSDQILVLEK